MRISIGNVSRFCESVRLAAYTGEELLIARPFSYTGDALSVLPPAQYFSTNHMCLPAHERTRDEVGWVVRRRSTVGFCKKRPAAPKSGLNSTGYWTVMKRMLKCSRLGYEKKYPAGLTRGGSQFQLAFRVDQL